MTGELISTGITYGNGRISLNDSFSGTAFFNNISLDSGGNLSAGTGGGKIFYGGVEIDDVFSGATYGNLWSASTGLKSIVSNNELPNEAAADYSFVVGSGNTLVSSTGIHGVILGGISNTMTFAGGSTDNEMCNAMLGGKFNEVRQSAASARRSSIIGGNKNRVSGVDSSIIGGSGNTITSSTNGGSVILGGVGNTISAGQRSIILGGQYLTITDSDTVGMQKAYINEYLDLTPQTSLPTASQGRMFFSGGSLNRIMYNSGGTAADWIII